MDNGEKHKRAAVALVTAMPGAGHFSVAILYITMGILAGMLALGLRGEAPDIREAIRALRGQPFGPVLLLIVAFGALCLVGWRFLQAFADLEERGRSFVGWIQRGRFLFAGLIYAGVPFFVWEILLGIPGRSGEQLAEEAAGTIITQPFGWVILIGTGIGFLISAGYCLFQLCCGKFETWFECDEMTEKQKRICFALGRLGYAARGAIFLVVGYCLMVAAWNLNPREVEGQAGAMQTIVQQPLGPPMLGIISIGLVCFGIFSLASLRYGRIPREKVRQVVEHAPAMRPLKEEEKPEPAGLKEV